MHENLPLDSGHIPKILHGGNINIQNLEKYPPSETVVFPSSSDKGYSINNI